MPERDKPYTSTSLPDGLYAEIKQAGEQLGAQQNRKKPASVPEMVQVAWEAFRPQLKKLLAKEPPM